MKRKIILRLLKDKNNKEFYYVCIYNKYNYKQYVLNKSLAYTLFVIINFLHKYGFVTIKKTK